MFSETKLFHHVYSELILLFEALCADPLSDTNAIGKVLNGIVIPGDLPMDFCFYFNQILRVVDRFRPEFCYIALLLGNNMMPFHAVAGGTESAFECRK